MTPPITIEETDVRCHDDKFLTDLGRITMLMKKDIKDSCYLKSGRYFLPEIPLLTDEGNKSGLLRKLAVSASTDHCGATYQCCYLEMPMIRCWSKGIDDFGSQRIQYWDNSSYFMKSGYPVGIIILTETEIELFISPPEDEKAIVDLASSSKHNKERSILTIPIPHHYLNHKLYFVGHLDNDNILQDIGNVLPPLTPRVTDELADSFEKLGKATSPTNVGDLKMVVVKSINRLTHQWKLGKRQKHQKMLTLNPNHQLSQASQPQMTMIEVYKK